MSRGKESQNQIAAESKLQRGPIQILAELRNHQTLAQLRNLAPEQRFRLAQSWYQEHFPIVNSRNNKSR